MGPPQLMRLSEYSEIVIMSQHFSTLRRIYVKSLKMLARSFPHNGVRTRALRMCGFQIGDDVYIGEDLIVVSELLNGNGLLKIESRVAIAPRVTLVTCSHPNNSALRTLFAEQKLVFLEEDCWIGTGAIIMPGVTVGKCSVVAAGAVVVEDVPPYTVVAGVPASAIKTIQHLGEGLAQQSTSKH